MDRVSVGEISRLSIDYLISHGLEKDEAKLITSILLEAELRGRSSHGFLRLKDIAKKEQTRPANSIIELAHEKNSVALVLGNGRSGYTVAKHCTDRAIDLAKKTGLGLVGANDTDHCGMLGYYVSQVADRDLLGIALCHTSPRVVPSGGKHAVLGTNPIAAAFPSRNGQIVCDLSTAAITNGDILLAMQNGAKLPENSAFDVLGEATTDPQKARAGAVCAFGDNKGYALSVMIQILSGALMGAAATPQPGKDYGFFILAIDPNAFIGLSTYQSILSSLVEALKASGADKLAVLTPGERAFTEKKRREKEGIDIESSLLHELNSYQTYQDKGYNQPNISKPVVNAVDENY